jgi:hypothetical protein
MCGIPQSSISKLKRAVAVAAAVTESFSVYFVAFLVCHFSVEAAG